MSLNALKGGLIVSCQALPDEPLHSSFIMSRLALAAQQGGAVGIRANTVDDIREIRAMVALPMIGIVKKDYPDSPVYITPTYADAEALCRENLEIVALDATRRPRPHGETLEDIIAKIRKNFPKVLLMADTATLEEALHAEALGFDCIGTTLHGYTEETQGFSIDDNDFAYLKTIKRRLTIPIIGEGKLSTPEKACRALELGCHCIVVGGAITRPLEITRTFVAAVSRARLSSPPKAKLAVDLGGTKVLVALIRGREIEARIEKPTARDDHPDQWVAAVAALAKAWEGRFDAVGIAVTGVIHRGQWRSFNPKTLSIPDNYPLLAKAREAFSLPVLTLNDAHAAAWGEFAYGAGQGEDMVFLTLSTGLGGGVVLNGKLLSGRGGLTGSFGQTLNERSRDALRLEDETTGLWIAERAKAQGRHADARAVLAAAEQGEAWAEAVVSDSASKAARLCLNIQATFDPVRIVIGGGIGLNPFFFKQLQNLVADAPTWGRPALHAALLGKDAGAIGAADLAATQAL